MRLLKTRIQNFKLLKDVTLEFSTDPQRPLTVIRAENGSGKTSVLYALNWAFYGASGLPPEAKTLRLVSVDSPKGVPVTVQVSVEFDHMDSAGITTQYRLIRTMDETALGDDRVEKSQEHIRLMRTKDGIGEEEDDASLVTRLLPRDLKNVFFTDGEDVQTFITAADTKQEQVHRAIRQLLGIGGLELAQSDLDAVYRKFRTAAAKSAGADVARVEESLGSLEDEIEMVKQDLALKTERLINMREAKAAWEKDLRSINDVGDIDKLNANIVEIESDIERLEFQRSQVVARMRSAIESEEFSWATAGTYLGKALRTLEDLADRNIIPGTSIEVLRDRLDIGDCICGESLDVDAPAGERRRSHIEGLIEEQRGASDRSQLLTGVWHIARTAEQQHVAVVEAGKDYRCLAHGAMASFFSDQDGLTSKHARQQSLVEQRSRIDDSRVRGLVENISRTEGQISLVDQEIGGLMGRISVKEQEKADFEKSLRVAQDKAAKSDLSAIRRDVADDLRSVVSETLKSLESDHVDRVATKTSEMFLRIVGDHPEEAGGVFLGVRIDRQTFDISVLGRNHSRLNPAFELNGASQRALTLSFIWALMEVSGTNAPRIIDTPLGMVAGGVKTRMVREITAPPQDEAPDFQVVLLLTRSEIRDIEIPLDERAGHILTMTCSKDYPEDLHFPWEVETPEVRTCGCDHRHSCRTCARRYDEQHGVEFVDVARGE